MQKKKNNHTGQSGWLHVSYIFLNLRFLQISYIFQNLRFLIEILYDAKLGHIHQIIHL